MPNLYNNIEGMFTYQSFYDEIINKYHSKHPDNSTYFAEVGCWYGKSGLYLLEKLSELSSNTVVYFVDHWLGGYDEPESAMVKEKGEHYVYDIFTRNVNQIKDVEQHIIRNFSVDAATFVQDESFDFIFIDAGHRDWQCYNDMISWYPKLKPGGTIAGHDIEYPDVRKSVERFCKEKEIKFITIGSPIQCWKIEK